MKDNFHMQPCGSREHTMSPLLMLTDASEMDVSLIITAKQAPISWLTILLELHMIFKCLFPAIYFIHFKIRKDFITGSQGH